MHVMLLSCRAYRAWVQLEVVLIEVCDSKACQTKDALHKVHCTKSGCQRVDLKRARVSLKVIGSKAKRL